MDLLTAKSNQLNFPLFSPWETNIKGSPITLDLFTRLLSVPHWQRIQHPLEYPMQIPEKANPFNLQNGQVRLGRIELSLSASRQLLIKCCFSNKAAEFSFLIFPFNKYQNMETRLKAYNYHMNWY